MSTKQDLWTAIDTTITSLGQFASPAVLDGLKQIGLLEINGWQRLTLATAIAPEPITPERIAVRDPYTNPEKQAGIIKGLQEAGYLDENGTATDKAQTAINDLYAIQRAHLATVNPLDETQTARMIDIQQQIVDNLVADTALDKPSAHDSLKRQKVDDMPQLERFLVNYSLFSALRDDAHHAAWKSLYIDGTAWEIFSFIWQGDATSYSDIPYNRMEFRAHSDEDCEKAMQRLIDKGWLEKADEGDAYKITEKGQQVRDDAEARTDSLFYGALGELDEQSLSDYIAYLDIINQTLTKINEENAEEQPA